MRYVAILVCAICLAFVASVLVEADNISYWMPSTGAEFKSNRNQPNGYAGLDANGMIGTNVIANIYVVFDGGPRD